CVTSVTSICGRGHVQEFVVSKGGGATHRRIYRNLLGTLGTGDNLEQFIKTMTDSRPYVSSQEAREEADWIQMETAKAWLRRYEASTDLGKLAMCKLMA